MRARGGWVSAVGWRGGACVASHTGSSWSLSLMGSPFSAAVAAATTNFERVPILDDPLQGLALFQFQGLSQRRRTDEIKLAVFAAPLNDLQFREVCHPPKLAISLVPINK